jgi:hypothetical protein
MKMWRFILAHSTILSLAAFYTMSAAVGALEMPVATDSKFYRWFFRFANTVSANLSRSGAAKLSSIADFPQGPRAAGGATDTPGGGK